MSESEIQLIKEHLEHLTKSVTELQADMKRVIFCLLGDMEKNDGCGLLASHKERGKEFEQFKDRVNKLDEKVCTLENVKREAMSWIAGAIAVVGIGVYLVEKFLK